MTTYSWTGGGSGNWADPANWTPTGYPSVAGDTALIDSAGTYTLTVAGGETDTIDSLTLNAAAATLAVNGTLTFGGADTATVSAGTVIVGSTGAIAGNPDLTIAAGATLDFSAKDQSVGSLSGAGLVLLGSHTLTAGGNGASTTFSGTLHGGGQDSGALVKTGAGTLTLDDATMDAGEFIVATGHLAIAAGTNQLWYAAFGEGNGNTGDATISGGILNIGTVPTDGSAVHSALQVGDFGGTGLITQTGGTLNVVGSFNLGNQGGTGVYDLMAGTVTLALGVSDIGRNGGSHPAGSGTLNVSGGLFDIQSGSFVLGNLVANNGSSQSSGLVHQTGGTVLVEGPGQIFLSAVGNGEYDLDGGTLEVGGSGLMSRFNGDGTGTLHMGGGTLAVTGAALTTDATVILDALTSSTLALGALTATFTGTLSGAGTLAITGSGIASVSALISTSTISLGAGSTLSVAGAVGSGETIAFKSATGTLSLGTPGGFTGMITGFATGNRIDLSSNAFDINGTADFNTASGMLTVAENGATFSAHLIGDYTGKYFHLADDGNGGTFVTDDEQACFVRGTRILTPDGEVAVEALRIDDFVTTLDGSAQPIVWIGKGRSLVTPKNPGARPVIVRKDAISDGVPSRDLYLTKAHSLYLDDVLIPVEHLINGHSILWDMTARVVEYYHVELPAHGVIIADGAASESYFDGGNRDTFLNTDRLTDLPETDWCAPVLAEGPIVSAVWKRLLDRSGFTPPPMTQDADLHLIADGVRIAPATIDGTTYRFDLAQVPFDLRIGSRSAVPRAIGKSHDLRRLGVPIRALKLQGAELTVDLPSHSPLLQDGFHPAEAARGVRWTDGDASVPSRALLAFDGAFALTIETAANGMEYSVEPGTNFNEQATA